MVWVFMSLSVDTLLGCLAAITFQNGDVRGFGIYTLFLAVTIALQIKKCIPQKASLRKRSVSPDSGL
ncbi:MAG: hypothetical protein QW445_07230 [Candidatus Bathyarchaeia archaeon]